LEADANCGSTSGRASPSRSRSQSQSQSRTARGEHPQKWAIRRLVSAHVWMSASWAGGHDRGRCLSGQEDVDCDAKVPYETCRVSRPETILSKLRLANAPAQKASRDGVRDCDARFGAESHPTTGPRIEKRETRMEKRGLRSEKGEARSEKRAQGVSERPGGDLG
jgi:hypothetical protein